MNGWDYERVCQEFLLSQGFENVQVTKGSGDFGCDIIAEYNNEKYGIQCKYYDENVVGVKAVQEAVAGSVYYGCSRSMVITNSHFTKNAKEYAERCGAILMEEIDAVAIVEAIRNAAPRVESKDVNSILPFCVDAYYKRNPFQLVAEKGMLIVDAQCITYEAPKLTISIDLYKVLMIETKEHYNYLGETFGRMIPNGILIVYKEGESIKKQYIRVHHAPKVAEIIRRIIQNCSGAKNIGGK